MNQTQNSLYMGQLGRPKWYGNGPLHDDMFGFGPRKLPFKQKIVGKQPHTILQNFWEVSIYFQGI